MQTLRGNGPAPYGFRSCFDPKCPARREPWSGRYSKAGHYHPIVATPGVTDDGETESKNGGL